MIRSMDKVKQSNTTLREAYKSQHKRNEELRKEISMSKETTKEAEDHAMKCEAEVLSIHAKRLTRSGEL